MSFITYYDVNLANTYFAIMYFIREIGRSRKGMSYALMLCKCQSARSSSAWVWNHISLVWTHVIDNSIWILTKLNAALCNNRLTTCGEKQQQSSRSEQSKGTPLRNHTNNDHFRCLINIWSIGIARRGLNELIFVKTSNSTKTDIFHFFCL